MAFYFSELLKLPKPLKMNLNYTLLKLLFFTIVLFPLQPAVYCQNFGLKQPQDKSTLPHSREKIIFPKQNTNSDTLPKLNKINPDEFQLQKGWKLIEAVKCDGAGKSISSSHFDTSHWYNATVPGTVLTTLVDQGVYPDPFYGLNNLSIPDSLSRQSWWYRMEFNAPKSSKNKSWLILNGINYKARVWFNGHLLGKIEGAFLKKKFDISRSRCVSGAESP